MHAAVTRNHGTRVSITGSVQHIVVLGATGFVGRALVLALLGRGHTVTVLARSPERARHAVPAGVDVADFTEDAVLRAEVERADAVVNLAGEPIAGKRWTKRRKHALIDSRVEVTRRLVEAIVARSAPLPVLVSASASGWYGDRGDELLDENAPRGEGFAAELCELWEQAAHEAAPATERVCIARFGIILGRDGGALRPLERLFRLGLGGPIGGGAQWMPWIHLDDAVGAVVRLVEDPQLRGIVAVTAPTPARQRDFAAALGAALHRPALVPAPSFALRALLGEAASIVLASQRLLPRVLAGAGFAFRFPTLPLALADLVDDGVCVAPVVEVPASAGYLRARRPRYTLTARTELDAPLDEVFAFFSSPGNLAALTPPELGFEILGDPPEMGSGTVIDYKIRVGGAPLRWRTRIEQWEQGAGFVDSQERGPYRAWWHEHRFTEHDGKTIMEDTVHYAPPLGPIGALANRLVVERMLRRIFGYRRAAIRHRFMPRA